MRGPPHFIRLERGPCVLWVRACLAPAARDLGLLEPEGLATLLQRAGGGSGRAPAARVALPGHRAELHLRPVRHGGWLAPLWRGASLGLARPVAELEVTARLLEAGAPVARPALAVGRRRLGPVFGAALGTVFEAGAQDGRAFLAARPEPRRVLRAAAAAGRAVRRFHDRGGRHPDLHLGNLLLHEDGDATRVLVIDLDRARIARPPSARARMAELMRLARALAKWDLAPRVGPRGVARFFSSYLDGDRTLRRALLRHLPRERWRLQLHALGWRAGLQAKP